MYSCPENNSSANMKNVMALTQLFWIACECRGTIAATHNGILSLKYETNF